MSSQAITGSRLVLAEQALMSGVSFTTSVLFARILDIESYGVYALILIVVYLGMSIENAVVIQPMQTALAKFDNPSVYLTYLKKVHFKLLGVLTAIALLGIVVYQNFWDAEIFSLRIGALSILLLVSWLSFDFGRKTHIASDQLTQALKQTIVLAILVLVPTGVFLFSGAELDVVLTTMIIGYGVAGTFSLTQIKSKIIHRDDAIKFQNHHKESAKYLLGTALLQWANGNAVALLSGMFLGVKALGALRLVQSIFGIFNVVLQSVENFVIPKYARMLGASQEVAKQQLTKYHRYGVLSSILGLLPMFLFSEAFITLIGGTQYLPYHNYIKAMAVLYLFIAIGYRYRIEIRANDANKNFFIGYVLSVTIGLVALVPLLQWLGGIGAIVCLILSQLTIILYWNRTIKYDF